MIKLIRQGAYYTEEGRIVKEAQAFMTSDKKAKAVKGTLAHALLSSHGVRGEEGLSLRFDAAVADDTVYADVIRMAKGCGLSSFGFPCILTNGHGGAYEGVRAFGLSAAKKYGADFVPVRLAGAHRYLCEYGAKGGTLIFVAGARLRLGALGALAVEGSVPTLVRLLAGEAYKAEPPQTVAVCLRGKLARGVGPADVGLALVAALSAKGFARDKILEFVGPGVAHLTMEDRIAIDLWAAETGCFSTLWQTDGATRAFFAERGREGDFAELRPACPAFYDGAVTVDLSKIEPMVALPYQLHRAVPLSEFLQNPTPYIENAEKEGKKYDPAFSLCDVVKGEAVRLSFAEIGGADGGSYEDLAEAAEILRGRFAGGDGFLLSVCPASGPVLHALAEGGSLSPLIDAGAAVYPPPSFPGCGRNGGVGCCTRPDGGANFVMDARSVAATAARGGILTSACTMAGARRPKKVKIDQTLYDNALYRGIGKPQADAQLVYGPEIADWPAPVPLADNFLIKIVSRLADPVTVAEDLLPADARFPFNPAKLTAFALFHKDSGYVGRAEEVRACEEERKQTGKLPERVLQELGGFSPAADAVYACAVALNKGAGPSADGPASTTPAGGPANTTSASAVSLLGRAVSCQKVLGGVAQIGKEYAQSYRAALIRWGIVPFTCEKPDFRVGDHLYIAGLADAVSRGEERIVARCISGGKERDVVLALGPLTAEERAFLLAGGLMGAVGAQVKARANTNANTNANGRKKN